MNETSRNFTSMTNEEIMAELEKAEGLHLAIKRVKSQLGLLRKCPSFILWDKDKRELSGEEAVRYLEKRLLTLTRELMG